MSNKLFSVSAQGFQQLLKSMQPFCATNGLTISISKQSGECWLVKTSSVVDPSHTVVGMLFHEYSALQSCFSLACASARVHHLASPLLHFVRDQGHWG